MAKYIESLMLNWEQYYIDTEWVSPITTPWIYHNSDLWLISLSSDGSSWVTISDKNLWATTVYNSGDTLSEANCGKYYQWGNNYWFPFTWTVTTSSTKVHASSYWPWNYYSSSTFITVGSSPRDWSSVRNDNLWWWVTWTNAAMQWPAPSGFHVPLNTEWQSVYDIWTALGWWSSDWTNFWIALKLPFAGLRDYSSSSVGNVGSYGLYWSSTAYSADIAYYLFFSSSSLNPQSGDYRALGFSVRCFKNTPTIPDSSWTKLY